ncbi:MAG TPA: hypothetical protein PLG20_09575, partial [Candidatus Syntrophosphaera sp.]|nr:hypothetical protein [Candidatus Syntrophosphaera sp.]
MKNYKIRTACIVVVLLMAAFAARSAVAQEKGKSLKQPLKLEIKANLVSIVEKNGKKVTELKPADNAERGDVLVYAITYTNEGKAPLKDISVVDPVPKGTVYIIGSADGKDTEIGFSIDGGRVFQKPPIKYIEEKPDGKS